MFRTCFSSSELIRDMPSDTLAERLRRRPAKPMGSPRVGSNPTGVVVWWTCPCYLEHAGEWPHLILYCHILKLTDVTLCPSGYGDGLGIHWALPAEVRIPSVSF